MTRKNSKPKSTLQEVRQSMYIYLGMLIFSLAVLVGGSIFMYDYVQNYAKHVAGKSKEAIEARDKLNNVENLKRSLIENASIVELAKQTTVKKDKNLYQDQIIQHVKTLAQRASLTPTSYTFSDVGGKKGGAATPAPAAGAAKATKPAVSGVTPTTISLTFEGQLNSVGVLRFLDNIEQSPIRMQATDFNFSDNQSSGDGTQGGEPKSPTSTITIEVYLQ